MTTVPSLLQVRTNHDGVIPRRSFLRDVAVGGMGLGFWDWSDTLTLQAEELRKRGMACILLWMGGGPSQFETFDPKPGMPTGGPTQAIPTAVNGIHIAEGWTQTAKVMKEIALVRSMTSKEGEHQRASYHLHTGYTPSPTVQHPSIGSIAATEIAPGDFPLPHFVRINDYNPGFGAGFLGARAAPFNVRYPRSCRPTSRCRPASTRPVSSAG